MMSSPIGKRAVVVGGGMGGLTAASALGRLAALDPVVHRLTAEVQNLLKPRSAYLGPELVQRIQALIGSR